MIQESSVSLSTRTLLLLLSMVAAGVTANLSLMYNLNTATRNEMVKLDRAWQDRVESLHLSLSQDLHDLEQRIPPTWFRDIVAANRVEIDRLKERIVELEKK